MAQVKDLVARQGNVDIVVQVEEVSDAREFSKFGKPGRVATATAKDETGSVKLTLWNEQIDQVKPGDRIHIRNGYVSEWQGEKQLSTGRMGTLEVVSSESRLPKKTEPQPDELAEEETVEEDSIE